METWLAVVVFLAMGNQLGAGPDIEHLGPPDDAQRHCGRPFTARFEEQRVSAAGNAARVASGSVFRDRYGRTLKQVVIRGAGDEILFDTIHDPIQRVLYVLRPDAKIAIRKQLPETASVANGGWLFAGTDPVEVGAEEIEGLSCHHFRLRNPPELQRAGSVVDDVWVSDDLAAVLREEARTQTESYTWRLFDIRKEEPAEALFSVPPDFTVLLLPE